jgi:hypothetical protein
MYSWLSAYTDKQCIDITEPTWRKFLDSLRHVGQTKLADDIEGYLKKAPGPAISHKENKIGEYKTRAHRIRTPRTTRIVSATDGFYPSRSSMCRIALLKHAQ